MERTVRDVMTQPVVTAAPNDSVARVAARMYECRVGSVVIVDADRRMLGILTERDLLRMASTGDSTSTASVESWMTEDPDAIDPDVNVAAALDLLRERGYRHMPVVHEGELVGVVSMRDLMRIAQIAPSPGATIDVPRGLKGVIVDRKSVV